MKASMKPTSDHDIIELFFQRNENAITETDRKYRAYLLTVAKGFVNDKEDAEECLNDTYHDTWNKIPPARPENLKAFLAVIMRRTAIDRLKHETRKKRISAGFSESLSEAQFSDMSDFIESILQGVDILIDRRLEDVAYDSTIICTIMDDSDKKNGKYSVTDGSIVYVAYSD
jgi:RNA polymerase sigma-70 factor (ECF subfamily)